MAKISNQKLKIENIDDTNVKVTVSYDLTPGPTEKSAGSVFQEDIVLMGDDSGKLTPLFTYANGPVNAQYTVNSSTTTVSRSRDHNLPKSTLNEDPGFLADGAQDPDEIVAQITISYAANAPTTPNLPPTTTTNTKTGAWV